MGDPGYHATFAGGVPSLEDNHDLFSLAYYPVLKLYQFDLETVKLL